MQHHPEYRYIPGYDKKYAITKDGCIVSFWHTKVRIIKIFLLSGNYWACCLSSIDKRTNRTRTIASIVMDTWGPPKPTPKHKVNFIDGDRNNYKLDNLEWMTKSEIMSKTMNRIKGAMKKRPHKRMIIVIDGYHEISRILGHSVQPHMNKGKKTKWGYYVFDEKGYAKWKLLGEEQYLAQVGMSPYMRRKLRKNV